MVKLSVNVNKLALLRNSRDGKGPDVLRLSELALDCGAHGITVHPRPDERHIRRDDARQIGALLRDRDEAEFNVEGNPFEGEWMKLVLDIAPDQATLVPDDPNQSTSDHGFEAKDVERLKPIIAKLKDVGCRVSVFVDPVESTAAAMAECGADRVELYTERYAVEFAKGDTGAAGRFACAATAATKAGLGVNAGHDLNLSNLTNFHKSIPELAEVSIGHALVGDAIEFGLSETIRRYLACLGQEPPARKSIFERASAQRASLTEESHGMTNLIRRSG